MVLFVSTFKVSSSFFLPQMTLGSALLCSLSIFISIPFFACCIWKQCPVKASIVGLVTSGNYNTIRVLKEAVLIFTTSQIFIVVVPYYKHSIFSHLNLTINLLYSRRRIIIIIYVLSGFNFEQNSFCVMLLVTKYSNNEWKNIITISFQSIFTAKQQKNMKNFSRTKLGNFTKS